MRHRDLRPKACEASSDARCLRDLPWLDSFHAPVHDPWLFARVQISICRRAGSTIRISLARRAATRTIQPCLQARKAPLPYQAGRTSRSTLQIDALLTRVVIGFRKWRLEPACRESRAAIGCWKQRSLARTVLVYRLRWSAAPTERFCTAKRLTGAHTMKFRRAGFCRGRSLSPSRLMLAASLVWA